MTTAVKPPRSLKASTLDMFASEYMECPRAAIDAAVHGFLAGDLRARKLWGEWVLLVDEVAASGWSISAQDKADAALAVLLEAVS